jgi:IS30 family transposase
MLKQYKQLTLEQRYKIEAYVSVGKSQSAIALLLGVHKSTISRELRRNTPKRGVGAKLYVAVKADVKTKIRHKNKEKAVRFSDSMKDDIVCWFNTKKYSPALVSVEWLKQGKPAVSHETIYKFIWHCKHTNKRCNTKYKNLYKLLKHGHRKRKRGNYNDSRGLIPNRVSIDQRPKVVENRKRFGDIEVDLIMGARHKSALLVTVDRKTLLTTIDKLQSKNAQTIAQKIIQRMKKYPAIKTMTFDNDQAFSEHQKIASALSIKTYFTRPYTSQDKGTIENRNGIIRRFFPKKTDFTNIGHWQIKNVETLINNRPVKKFNYLTPNQLFSQIKGKVALMS